MSTGAPAESDGQAKFHMFTDEQQQLRKEIREFAAREIAPNVSRWDEASEFPAELVKELGRMGLMGVIFPQQYGGSELGYVEYVIAIEGARVDGSVGIIVASHNSLATNHIFLAGTEAQRQKYVSKLASGEWLGAWGLTEPGSGWDAGGARTTAMKRGDRWVLNGNKTFITNGHYADVSVSSQSRTKQKRRMDCPHSSLKRARRDFVPGRKRTSWDCGPAIRLN